MSHPSDLYVSLLGQVKYLQHKSNVAVKRTCTPELWHLFHSKANWGLAIDGRKYKASAIVVSKVLHLTSLTNHRIRVNGGPCGWLTLGASTCVALLAAMQCT